MLCEYLPQEFPLWGTIKGYCIVLYCIVLYCIVLYCIVLYCIVLYCIVSFSKQCERSALEIDARGHDLDLPQEIPRHHLRR